MDFFVPELAWLWQSLEEGHQVSLQSWKRNGEPPKIWTTLWRGSHWCWWKGAVFQLASIWICPGSNTSTLIEIVQQVNRETMRGKGKKKGGLRTSGIRPLRQTKLLRYSCCLNTTEEKYAWGVPLWCFNVNRFFQFIAIITRSGIIAFIHHPWAFHRRRNWDRWVMQG